MIIDDTIRSQVGETVYDTWKDAALADLANMLCMNDLTQSTADMTGIVDDDGRHVRLPSWYSEVTDVKTPYGNSLEYAVEYDRSDGWSPETRYAKTLALAIPYLPGTPVTIYGTHGFDRLPKPLAGFLAAIIQADQAMADRTDSITSKRIEDVSVTYATNSQTTLERAVTPYRSLLDAWRLCHSDPDAGGCLSMPTRHHDLPWWINPQDYLGGTYTYGTAM